MEVFGLFLMSGWKVSELSVDIVPLFETVDDLQHAAKVMKQLYEFPAYNTHFPARSKKRIPRTNVLWKT
jgi:phosphoenolpyruvate carboxylase